MEPAEIRDLVQRDPGDIGASSTSPQRNAVSPSSDAAVGGPASGTTSAPRRRCCAKPRDSARSSTCGAASSRAPIGLELAGPRPGGGRPETLAEVDNEAEELAADYGRARRELLFSGPYDHRNAILAIHAGAGGTEATDWAEMLLRMYLRWAERHGFETEVLDRPRAKRPGIKSVTVEIDGPTPTAISRASAASTGWSASARSTRRRAATRRSPWSRSCRRSRATSKSS